MNKRQRQALRAVIGAVIALAASVGLLQADVADQLVVLSATVITAIAAFTEGSE